MNHAKTFVENRISWSRENLKIKGELDGSTYGKWIITAKGVKRLEKVALASLKWEAGKDEIEKLLDGLLWQRFSPVFLERLRVLGKNIQQRASDER